MYFKHGLSVSRIAEAEGLTREEVVMQLRAVSLNISEKYEHDAVCSSIFEKTDYTSFFEFAQDHSSTPIRDQARSLEVSRGTVTRIYQAFRNYLAKGDPNGDSSGGGDASSD